MRPINLLPAGIAEERSKRRRVFLVIAAIAVYIFALVVGVFYWNTKVANKVAEVEAQEQRNEQVRLEIGALGDAGAIVVELEAKSELVRTALAGEVDWGSFINDLSVTTPSTVWLNNMNGAATETSVGGLLAQVSFSGNGITGYGDVSAWIRSLDSVEYVSITGVWVPSAQQEPGPPVLVTFNSTAVLTSYAGTNRIEALIPVVGDS